MELMWINMFLITLENKNMKLAIATSYIQLMASLYGQELNSLIYNHHQSRGSLEVQRRIEERMLMKKRDEQQLKRARYGMKCSRCKAEGHNKSTCKLPPPPEPAQPSATQASATQASATQPSATQVSETQASATQPSATQASATQASTQPSASQHQVRSNSANAHYTTTSRASQKTKKGSGNATATATNVSSSQPATSTLKRIS
jgi:hypothetical protein